jgi:CRP/FNR family transcriptional regulator
VSNFIFSPVSLFSGPVRAEITFPPLAINALAPVYNRLIYLTQKQMPGRMADALLYLFDEIYQQPRFPMILSRFDLADLSAMSRESAVKILRDFQKEGLIRISDHEMELVDEEALRKISRIG